MSGYDTEWQTPAQQADHPAPDRAEPAAADRGEPTAADRGEPTAPRDDARSYRRELDAFLREADERGGSGGAGAATDTAAPDLAAAHADAARRAGMSAEAFLDATPAERGDGTELYPGPDCLGPHEVDAIVHGRWVDDARLAHIAECGRCATLLHAVDPDTTHARAATARALDGVHRALDLRMDEEAAAREPVPGGWRGVIALAAVGVGIVAAMRRRTTIHVREE